ncbi:unnamed protein product [Pleuronectes platessa]|uniref:Uncharacterized protein n=1 Tax=Pleuronectes platessa TaxID=8262 RepID=A0A9N7Y6E2_PLEPL|nr:unnamed protein product [Pleuronectes platessa]
MPIVEAETPGTLNAFRRIRASPYCTVSAVSARAPPARLRRRRLPGERALAREVTLARKPGHLSPEPHLPSQVLGQLQ